MLPGALFCATQRLFRQMRHHGLDASPKHIERNGILGKLVRIDQTTAGLVESVGRKAIVDMKIIRGMEVAGVVIPTAHIRARSGQARTLSKWFQQRVLIQAEKQFVVVFKLCPEESLEQLN